MAVEITATNGTVFQLNRSEMTEVHVWWKWFAKRAAIRDAIKTKPRKITVGLRVTPGPNSGPNEYPKYGCAFGQKAIRIGCMKFTGEDEAKLRKWALGDKA